MDLSIAEAARLLGKSERQVRYLLQTGQLPAQKKDGHWRILWERSPGERGQKLLERMRGRATSRMSTEEILALTRGES